MSRLFQVLRAVAVWLLLSNVVDKFILNKDAPATEVKASPAKAKTFAQPLLPFSFQSEEMTFDFVADDIARATGIRIPLAFIDPVKVTLPLNLTKCVAANCSFGVDIHVKVRHREATFRQELTKFIQQRPKLKNLFDDNSTMPEEVRTKSFFQPSLAIQPVVDFQVFNPAPPQVEPYLLVENHKYFPIVFLNNFWMLDSMFVEFNESSVNHNFTIEIEPTSFLKFMLYTQMEASFDMHESWGSMAKKERDETKRIFLETNPWLLGVTMTVSCLHLLFEYLAMSNDVSFWKGRKNFKGLSLKTILLNSYFSTVIFLYLLDGETSYTVLIPNGIGVLIEYWKLYKTVVLTVGADGKRHLVFTSSYDEKTREHDEKAMKYLFLLMVPCLVGYSVYSALYDTHKGWYSFLITCQVRFIYFFGFAMMTPQIFINYKLKSVTHLPWRTFVYKALNTFIDDLFAFVIKMPMLHRLACFRDDIIFVILLYQRWIYPVDKSRTEDDDAELPVNESKLEKLDEKAKQD